jgi:phosphatidylglycerol:prolipoprotein diacylglycerol transferase
MTNEWFDPVLVSLGPLQVRWYGLMYVLGFLAAGYLLKQLAKDGFWKLPVEQIDKYITTTIVGMFLGARFFYVFIYNWDQYSQNPHEVFYVWQGGLSFHGALFGMCLATWWFAHKHKLHFFELADCMAAVSGPGLLFGRIGNFINGELYGRVTTSAFGIVFPDGGPFPRHPSQLYEGILEGIILGSFLFWLHRRQKIYGMISTLFLIGYGSFRFIVEFFREPDAQLGYYFGVLTMGQILCLVMIAFSSVIFFLAKKANRRVILK